jgi:hypothetical protein
MEVANTEPPHRLRFVVEHSIFHSEFDYLIDGIYGGGCRMSLIFRSRPGTQVEHAAHPFMTPFMAITLRDKLEQDLTIRWSDRPKDHASDADRQCRSGYPVSARSIGLTGDQYLEQSSMSIGLPVLRYSTGMACDTAWSGKAASIRAISFLLITPCRRRHSCRHTVE